MRERPEDAASGASRALEVARRIVATDNPAQGEAGPKSGVAALERSCARVTDALRRSMGDVGSAALISRALARTETAHPALKTLRRPGDPEARLDGIAAIAAVYGTDTVKAAIEALLAAIIDILIRLIGEDMAIRLIDFDDPRSQPRGGSGPS